MTERGTIQITITVDKATGKVVKPLVDENGVVAKELSPAELEAYYQRPGGLKYIGTILYTHSSPGCVIISIGGTSYLVCWPQP